MRAGKALVAGVAMATAFGVGASAAPVAVETSVAVVGEGSFTSQNNGLSPAVGATFFGFTQATIGGTRAGLVHLPFSSLGLGPSLRPGTYTLAMRVASNGQQYWPGAKDMARLDSGTGYGGGFFTQFAYDPAATKTEEAEYSFNSMAKFNQARGVRHASSGNPLATAPVATSNMLAKTSAAAGFHQDTWYGATSTWTIAMSSPVVGTDPQVGLGFTVGLGNGGAVYIDDGTLTYSPLIATTAILPVEETTAFVGNGDFWVSNNGVFPESGTRFFGMSNTAINGSRAGLAYVRLSDLGLGLIQPGTYQLVMRVANNGNQNWPGLRDMTVLDGGSGYANGFFTVVGSGSSLALAGEATLNHMVDFNNTPGVTYAPDSSFLAAPNPLPLTDQGMLPDTWYSATSMWTIAKTSSIVGMDAYVGVGFEIGNTNSGSVYIDDSTLTFIAADELFEHWRLDYPTMGILTNLTDDADGDTVNNLAEYAFGGNPADSSHTGHHPLTLLRQTPAGLEGTHPARSDAVSRGLAYRFEQATNLVGGTWIAGNTTVLGSAALDSQFDCVTNLLPFTAANAQYSRLKVGFERIAPPLHTPKTMKSIARILGQYPELSAQMGARWYYNWGKDPGTNQPPNMEFVPMQWTAPRNADGTLNTNALRSDIQYILATNPGCTNLLVFNEPDMPLQADLTVAMALDAWEIVEEEVDAEIARTGRTIRLGSPAPTGIVDNGWQKPFMDGVENRGLRVDFMAVHYRTNYDSSGGATAIVDTIFARLKTLYGLYGRPVWITEMELNGYPTIPTQADVNATWSEFALRLESDPTMDGILERYALALAPVEQDPEKMYKYPARPFETNGTLTVFGRVFQGLHEPSN